MFYDNYIKLCNSVGKSPSAVANELGLNKSAVSNWKNRGTSPTDATLQKVANYFGCTVAELTGETKKPTGIAADELSESEIKVLELFRLLPRDRQIVITSIIEDTLRMYGII